GAQLSERAGGGGRAGVPKRAWDEAKGTGDKSADRGIAVRALRIVADALARLRRYEMAARTLGVVADRVAPERRPAVRLEQARLLRRAGQRAKALAMLTSVENSPTESEAAEAGYLKGEMLEDMDHLAEAASTYRSVASRYPTRNVAGQALWRPRWNPLPTRAPLAPAHPRVRRTHRPRHPP